MRESDLWEEVRAFRAENERHLAEIQRLRGSLQAEIAKSEQIKISASRMQLQMDNKELFVGVQFADDVVQGKFQGLLGQLRSWVSKFGQPGPLDHARLDRQTVDEFEAVAPGCLKPSPSALWEQAKMRRMLIRGWVSLIATRTVFRAQSGDLEQPSAPLDVWMGEAVQRSVATIENKLSFAGMADFLLTVSPDSLLGHTRRTVRAR